MTLDRQQPATNNAGHVLLLLYCHVYVHMMKNRNR
jgi:hypothetical protein